MSNNDFILSLTTVFLSGCLSYITARLTSKKEYKKSVLDEVYKNIVFPIYDILYDDIEMIKIDSSYLPSQAEIEQAQSRIMKVLRKSGGTYTHKFYMRCVELSSETFRDFCEYINRNYEDCVSALDYFLPYGYFGRDKKKARIMLLVSAIVLSVGYFLLYSGIAHSKEIGRAHV